MKNVDYEKIRPIIEVFNSIEGEGNSAGEATIFVRLSGCNLRCCFENSICDTAYSSFGPEKGQFNYQSVIDMIEKHPRTQWLSITGGEPFLYPEVVKDLIDIAKDYHLFVIVETNGTIAIDTSILQKIDLLNVSPKLSSSIPTDEKLKKIGRDWDFALRHHNENRFNKEALHTLLATVKDFSLKYVVGRKEDFEEIENQIRELIDYDIKINKRERFEFAVKGKQIWYDCEFIRFRNIILMPAGSTNEELDQNRQMVAEYCANNGYRYSDRLQIIIWGTKRGV